MKRLASFLLVLMVMLSLAACGAGEVDPGPENEPGAKYGSIGDTLSTKWFDFTVDDAYSCGQYQGYTPSEGYKLVVVTVTLKNDCGQLVDMWGEDFVLMWGDDDDSFDLDIPLPAGLSGDQFPDEYVLDVNETKSGVMVFEAPREFQNFTVGFMEFFDSDTDPDGEEGDTFFVDFTAEDRE